MKSLVKSNMLKSNKNVSGVVKPYAGSALCTILTCIIFLFLNHITLFELMVTCFILILEGLLPSNYKPLTNNPPDISHS